MGGKTTKVTLDNVYVSLEKQYNPDIQKGLAISFDPKVLTHFTQWKMMGQRDYVFGLEPGNCHPDGRDVMRRQGTLQILEPGESATFTVTVTLFEEQP